MGYFLGQGTAKPIVFDIGGVKTPTVQPLGTSPNPAGLESSLAGTGTSSATGSSTDAKMRTCRKNCYDKLGTNEGPEFQTCVDQCMGAPGDPGSDIPSQCSAYARSRCMSGPNKDGWWGLGYGDTQTCIDQETEKCNAGGGPPGGGPGGGGGDGDGPNGPVYEGCSNGKYYATNGSTCRSGYVYVARETKAGTVSYAGRCECQKWCVDVGCTETCVDCGSGDTQGKLGEYTYPDKLLKLMGLLQGRAGEYLNKKPGFGSSVLEQMFGQNYDAVRGAGKLSQDQLLASLQGAGMEGTGAGNQAMTENSWNTEKSIGDLIRNVQIAGEQQKRTDLADYTKMGSDLTGQGVTFEQIKEAINASRRGEGLQSMALMIQYLTALMNSWGQ